MRPPHSQVEKEHSHLGHLSLLHFGHQITLFSHSSTAQHLATSTTLPQVNRIFLVPTAIRANFHREIRHHFWVGTCEASIFDSNSNRTSRFEFDLKVTCRFENFESAAHVVCRHTTNYAHTLFNKNINLCAVCSWGLFLQLHFTCSCTAVAGAHTQLPHNNWHWTF